MESDKLESEQPTYGVPMPLNLNCKVFLSHSGCDKEFVRFLHEALCRRYHNEEVGFFDEKSLPPAVAISMINILEEARRIQLGVLVLTKAFFVKTPNPMLELEAFILGEVRLLPLFYGMSVEELKKKIQSRSWEDQWRKWLTKQSGGTSNVEEKMESWRRSLDHVTTFSRLERKRATSDLEYIQKIVDQVTKAIPPTILLSEKGVCGMERLCKMVDEMYEKCAAKNTSPINRLPSDVASTSTSPSLKEEYRGCTTVGLVGIHGFPGLGKTTLCKCLCDFYFAEFNGRAFYRDVGSSVMDHASSQKHSMLSSLTTSNNNGFLSSQVIEQGKIWSNEQLSSMRYPVFLAIDNILPTKKSLEEASFYLSRKFPKGSKILITSKSESILTNLASLHSRSFSITIEYMPALIFEEAKDIFVHEFPNLHELGLTNLEDGVTKCVEMCKIHRRRYHPLMLKSLAASLKWDRSISNLDWEGRLMKLQREGITYKEDAWEEVFSVFDNAYALLSEESKRVFLDLALFCNATPYKSYKMDGWIKMLHTHLRDKDINKIILQLQDLCFLEKGKLYIEMLDLMVDFGKYKAGLGLFPDQYLVRDSTNWLADLPRRATTVSISGCGQKDMNTGLSLDLRAVEGVKVLHIVNNPGLQKVWLSGITCAHLRSLIVRVPEGTSLIWSTCGQEWPRMSAETGDEGLRWVEIEGDFCFSLSPLSEKRSIMTTFSSWLRHFEITSALDATDPVSTLRGLRNLEVLCLSRMPSVQSIDVTTCANLKKLDLFDMPSLRLISGFENLNLEEVSIEGCHKLMVLTIPADSKAWFLIYSCNSLKRISFVAKPSCSAGARFDLSDGFCYIRDCQALANVDGFSQYRGSMHFSDSARLGKLVKMNAGPDLCDAEVYQLHVYKSSQELMLSAYDIQLENAQHIGLFITALFKAQPEGLRNLTIVCKKGGDCGCGRNPPLFGPLQQTRDFDTTNIPNFSYSCSQVKDLASLGQWHELKSLHLRGCTSVEVWPDLAAMTSLGNLDLSFTSLKEWPAGVQHLPHLWRLDMRGCQQLPADELMKVVTFVPQLATDHAMPIAVCILSSLASLEEDLLRDRRDRCLVANALDGVYLELVALFDRSSWSVAELAVLRLVVAIMYEVWLFGESADHVAQKLDIRTKMKRLLCNERFLSFPFRVCDRSLLSTRFSICFGIDIYLVTHLFDVGSREQEWQVKDRLMSGMMLEATALGAGAGSIIASMLVSERYNQRFGLIGLLKLIFIFVNERELKVGREKLLF